VSGEPSSRLERALRGGGVARPGSRPVRGVVGSAAPKCRRRACSLASLDVLLLATLWAQWDGDVVVRALWSTITETLCRRIAGVYRSRLDAGALAALLDRACLGAANLVLPTRRPASRVGRRSGSASAAERVWCTTSGRRAEFPAFRFRV
jgi:hypothetical protein